MSKEELYKKKALKYKLKYIELKKKLTELNKMFGGDEDWYNKFDNDFRKIYKQIENVYPKIVLTGSGAIAYVLKYLGMEEDLKKFVPSDADFLYLSKFVAKNPTEIGEYHINPKQIAESSVTFNYEGNDMNVFIKKFDVSKINNVKYFNLNGINVIDLKTLKSFYVPDILTDEDRLEKDKIKLEIIDKIINKINLENRQNEFVIVSDDENINKPEQQKNTRQLKSLFSSLDEPKSLFDMFNKQTQPLSQPPSPPRSPSPIIKKSKFLFGDDEKEVEQTKKFKSLRTPENYNNFNAYNNISISQTDDNFTPIKQTPQKENQNNNEDNEYNNIKPSKLFE